MVHEGQELALGCLARTSTQKHTHLAVSFGRSVPEAPVGRATLQEVVGIRSDLAVEAGAPYAERLAAGELRLGKEGTDRYRMVVGGAQAGDAGTYHCTAAEWIQDPDGSWAQIAEKRAVLAHVDVQTLCKYHLYIPLWELGGTVSWWALWPQGVPDSYHLPPRNSSSTE